jgi:hypothetical protein
VRNFNLFTFSDYAILIAAVAVIVAGVRKRLSLNVATAMWTMVVGILSLLIGAGNLILDTKWWLPPLPLLPLTIYAAGGSKGIVVGWLSTLIVFRLLRPDQRRYSRDVGSPDPTESSPSFT